MGTFPIVSLVADKEEANACIGTDLYIKKKKERVIVEKLKIDDKTILVANAYAPNNTTGKMEFFRHLGGVIDRLASGTTGVILMGDFNSVINNNEDVISGNKQNIQEVEALSQLVVNINAHDVWRLQTEEAREYTWNR